MSTELKKEIVKLNYLRIAPRKVRRLAHVIKNLPAIEAEAQLLHKPQRASEPILKLLRSAMANAKHNKNVDPEKLIVKDVVVNNGPMLKRWLPRAMGRATTIQKKSSHVTLVLEESAKPQKKFMILPSVKKEKKAKPARAKAEKKSTAKPVAEKKAGLLGRIKRLFSRKTG